MSPVSPAAPGAPDGVTSSCAASALSQAPTSFLCSSPPRSQATAASREAVAEHAGRAEHPLGVRPLGVEPRLDEAEHRVGERVLATSGHGAHQLLQVEKGFPSRADRARAP